MSAYGCEIVIIQKQQVNKATPAVYSLCIFLAIPMNYRGFKSLYIENKIRGFEKVSKNRHIHHLQTLKERRHLMSDSVRLARI